MKQKTLIETLRNENLNPNQIQIAILTAEGKSIDEISEIMGLNFVRIKRNLNSVLRSMGLRTTAQLIVWCLPHLNSNN